MHLNGKNRKMSFNGRKLGRNEQMDRRFMFIKIFWLRWLSAPVPGAIYMYMYMTKIFKHLLLRNRSANQSKTLCGASSGRGNESLFNWSRSHDLDGRQGYKKQKPLKIFFSRTRRPLILKVGMKHEAIELSIKFI